MLARHTTTNIILSSHEKHYNIVPKQINNYRPAKCARTRFPATWQPFCPPSWKRGDLSFLASGIYYVGVVSDSRWQKLFMPFNKCCVVLYEHSLRRKGYLHESFQLVPSRVATHLWPTWGRMYSILTKVYNPSNSATIFDWSNRQPYFRILEKMLDVWFPIKI